MQLYHNLFSGIASTENLFRAWEGFRRGKRSRPDVQTYALRLEENIFTLQRDLIAGRYRHGSYSTFTICDPKQRLIHKASVRDRIVHHAIFAALNPLFEPSFIAHSYSCRQGKGTHRAVAALEMMLRKVSRNGKGTCFALKCDVRKFFASVDHAILLSQLRRRIGDARVMFLLEEIIHSFHPSRGLPIGNLTSQLFANIYLNELDQFIKHELLIPYYVRYTDDFVIVSPEEKYLRSLITPIHTFLQEVLFLSLHPRKIILRKYGQGIDFLGYVLLPHHRMLRTGTKRRMFRRLHERRTSHRDGPLAEENIEQSLQSYLGMLSHANTCRLSQELRNQCWFWMHE